MGSPVTSGSEGRLRALNLPSATSTYILKNHARMRIVVVSPGGDDDDSARLPRSAEL